jgi:hypothetical protein
MQITGKRHQVQARPSAMHPKLPAIGKLDGACQEKQASGKQEKDEK